MKRQEQEEQTSPDMETVHEEEEQVDVEEEEEKEEEEEEEEEIDTTSNGAHQLTEKSEPNFGSTASLDNTPKPPDGGYGWVVVVGCMLGHVLVVGTARGFGIFYVALIEKFQMSAAATSLVPSLFNCLRMVLGELCIPLTPFQYVCSPGPLVSWLCDRFTVRKVVIFGGLMYSVGCVASAFATSLFFLTISFGVIAGQVA